MVEKKHAAPRQESFASRTGAHGDARRQAEAHRAIQRAADGHRGQLKRRALRQCGTVGEHFRLAPRTGTGNWKMTPIDGEVVTRYVERTSSPRPGRVMQIEVREARAIARADRELTCSSDRPAARYVLALLRSPRSALAARCSDRGRLHGILLVGYGVSDCWPPSCATAGCAPAAGCAHGADDHVARAAARRAPGKDPAFDAANGSAEHRRAGRGADAIPLALSSRVTLRALTAPELRAALKKARPRWPRRRPADAKHPSRDPTRAPGDPARGSTGSAPARRQASGSAPTARTLS